MGVFLVAASRDGLCSNSGSSKFSLAKSFLVAERKIKSPTYIKTEGEVFKVFTGFKKIDLDFVVPG